MANAQRIITLIKVMNEAKEYEIVADCKRQIRRLGGHVVYDRYESRWALVG